MSFKRRQFTKAIRTANARCFRHKAGVKVVDERSAGRLWGRPPWNSDRILRRGETGKSKEVSEVAFKFPACIDTGVYHWHTPTALQLSGHADTLDPARVRTHPFPPSESCFLPRPVYLCQRKSVSFRGKAPFARKPRPPGRVMKGARRGLLGSRLARRWAALPEGVSVFAWCQSKLDLLQARERIGRVRFRLVEEMKGMHGRPT